MQAVMPAVGLSPGTKTGITLSVMLATIMQVLDTTIANVALPHMQGSLMATQDQVAWVLTSYIVATAIMTLPVGWLAGRYGRRRVFLASVAGFTATSLLCGIAASMNEMIFYRVLQGAFGAALVPLSQATLLDINTRANHGRAMAMWGVGVMIGPIVGPTLGGFLTEYYSWRWVFYINLPLGVISFLGIMLFMPETRKLERPFDKLGFFTLSLTIGCLQLMLDRGEQTGWFDSREILFYCALAAAAAWVYAVHTRRASHPFLSPAMLRDTNFAMGLIFIFFVGIVLLATLALLPPYMQGLMGYPVLDVGLILAPRGGGTMIAMIIVGKLSNRVDGRALILLGLLLTAWSLHLMCQFTTFMPVEPIVTSGVIQGFGLGFIFVPLSTLSYATLEPRLRSEAASLFSLVRNLGSSIGVSAAFALLGRNIQTQHAYLAENVTPYSFALDPRLLGTGESPGLQAALSLLDAEINRQAATIAYLNDFKLMMWVVIAAIPLVFLMRRPALVVAKATAG